MLHIIMQHYRLQRTHLVIIVTHPSHIVYTSHDKGQLEASLVSTQYTREDRYKIGHITPSKKETKGMSLPGCEYVLVVTDSR